MTSIAAEGVSTILCSCKQTRFHIESPDYREVDIDGLHITVTSSTGDGSRKAKGKSRAEGTEILSNAKLRLKAGQRYALVGPNGSGKSTLLRAIAEKLIPGIPEETRVAILQQTSVSDADAGVAPGGLTPAGDAAGSRSVLEDVVDKATARDELEQEIAVLTSGINSHDRDGALRALRKVRHERLQKRHFVLDKDARLRSGARGLQARKALLAHEKEVAESAALQEQKGEELSPDAVEAETQEAVGMLADLQLQVEPARLAGLESRAKRILAGLGFSDAYMARPVASLSGGWRMRASLAAALLQDADVLILDEPTNFLDLLGIIWLQRHLQSLGDGGGDGAPTLVLVSHDRDFVSRCTADLLVLKDRQLTYFHGDLPSYEASTAERRQHLAKMSEAKERQRAHLQQTIQRNVREGKKNDDDNRLRQAKMRQRKLDERWGMEVSAKGGRFKLNRDRAGFHHTNRDEIEVPPEERAVSVALPTPLELRFPGPLISLDGVTFRYPAPSSTGTLAASAASAAPAVLSDVTLSVHMGDRIGILGLNGAGKSTLVKLLVGAAAPTRGTATTHPRLRLGYYSQHAVAHLLALGAGEPDLTALALLMREAGDSDGLDEGALRGLLGSLGLAGRTASDVPLRRLSGGQLVRCALARVLWRRPQCLVLDEVTTHLDYGTVGALREALRAWEGAVVVVSHDRWFVRGVVEGVTDGGSDADEEDQEDDAEGGAVRRTVHRLGQGALTKLEGGVQEFEDLMEKRVKKILATR